MYIVTTTTTTTTRTTTTAAAAAALLLIIQPRNDEHDDGDSGGGDYDDDDMVWYDAVLRVGAGAEVPVLPGSYWPHNVRHFQHVGDDTQLQNSAVGLHVLRTASLSVHPTAHFHTYDQGMYLCKQASF